MAKRASDPARDEERDVHVHECTTAQRAWPKELVDSVRSQLAARSQHRSATVPAPAPAPTRAAGDTTIRTESGTRPVVSREEIDRYARERSTQPMPEPYLTEAPTLPPPLADPSTAPTLPPPPQAISIDVDLSHLDAPSRKLTRRDVTIAILVALVFAAAVLGFLAGRLAPH